MVGTQSGGSALEGRNPLESGQRFLLGERKMNEELALAMSQSPRIGSTVPTL